MWPVAARQGVQCGIGKAELAGAVTSEILIGQGHDTGPDWRRLTCSALDGRPAADPVLAGSRGIRYGRHIGHLPAVMRIQDEVPHAGRALPGWTLEEAAHASTASGRLS